MIHYTYNHDFLQVVLYFLWNYDFPVHNIADASIFLKQHIYLTFVDGTNNFTQEKDNFQYLNTVVTLK